MTHLGFTLALLLALLSVSALAEPAKTVTSKDMDDLKKPLYTPFVKRYILDELKELKKDLYTLRTEMTEKITAATSMHRIVPWNTPRTRSTLKNPRTREKA